MLRIDKFTGTNVARGWGQEWRVTAAWVLVLGIGWFFCFVLFCLAGAEDIPLSLNWNTK